MKRGLKGIVVVTIGILTLSGILGSYVLFSEGSPFTPTYSLTVTVKDAYGTVEGATVDVGGNTYVTGSTGSILPLTLAKDTYVIVVTASEHPAKTQTIDLASDLDLIIEIDYTHQYLTVTSPTEGGLINPGSAKKDPTGLANIVIEVQGHYSPGRESGDYVKTFIDTDSTQSYNKHTPISSNWCADVYVGQLSPGEHILYVQFLHWVSQSSPVIEQQTVHITIPNEWHVSFSTVGLADSGEGISRNEPENPYWLGMNPPFPGKVTRIKGRFYLDVLGHEASEVWVDLWNPTINDWVIVQKISSVQAGWNSIDIGADYVTTSWWGFAGCMDSNGEVYNKVTEFDGEVWMSTGTYYNTASVSTLDWFYDQFFPAEEGTTLSGPTPVVSDDGNVLLNIESSDLYASPYLGSTATAWILCLVISLAIVITVAIILMKRRRII